MRHYLKPSSPPHTQESNPEFFGPSETRGTLGCISGSARSEDLLPSGVPRLNSVKFTRVLLGSLRSPGPILVVSTEVLGVDRYLHTLWVDRLEPNLITVRSYESIYLVTTKFGNLTPYRIIRCYRWTMYMSWGKWCRWVEIKIRILCLLNKTGALETWRRTLREGSLETYKSRKNPPKFRIGFTSEKPLRKRLVEKINMMDK